MYGPVVADPTDVVYAKHAVHVLHEDAVRLSIYLFMRNQHNDAVGIDGYVGPLLKAAGWISVGWDDTIAAIVDDALKIMLGVSGANNVNYASWSDGKAGTLSTWIVQGLGAMYSLKVPTGTWRFELHYANAQPLGVYLGVWPPMTYLNGFYHAKYLPASALPHVYVYGTQVQ